MLFERTVQNGWKLEVGFRYVEEEAV